MSNQYSDSNTTTTITEQNDAEMPVANAGERKSVLNKKKLLLAIIAAALIFIAVLRLIDAFKPAVISEIPPVNVKITKAQMGSLHTTAPLTGRIRAKDEIAVIPLATGEVTYVNVKIGDYVKKGTLLFSIDSTQAQNNVNQSQAAMDNAQAGVKQAQVAYDQAILGLENASYTYNSMKSLYDAGAVSLQQFLQAELQYKNTVNGIAAAEASLNAAKSGVKTAQAAVSSAEDVMANYIVTAPISAYITSVNVSVGSLAASSSPAITMANLDELEIQTTISEYLAGKLRQGDKVDIYIKSLSDKPFPGTVQALSPAPTMGMLTYPVTISVDAPKDTVKAGMFAEIQIISDKKDNVLRIPSSSVLIKGGQSTVATLDKKNIPTLKIVTTGLDSGEWVEIVAGLTEGEIVVVSGQEYISEGIAVKIVK